MTDLAPDAGFGKNRKLKAALLRHKPLSRAGLSERVFGFLFSGLVYAQIWEDPIVDMEAMDIRPHHRIITIGSGGCNMLAYLSKGPAHIDVVDLNRHHVALNRLKLAAFRYLPGHADVLRFLSGSHVRTNRQAYDLFLEPNLDAETRAHWNGRDLTGRRRVRVFNANIYRTGLLGRFIALGHIVARLHGVDPAEFTRTRSLREQRQFFEERLAPVFDRPFIRWITRNKSVLFGLGIPPQQFDELAGLTGEKSVAPVLRQRLEKLTCHFLLKENCFAWQAFGRTYSARQESSLPFYLQSANHRAIRDHAGRARVHHASFTEVLAQKPAASVDRYVLLDAQDWMTPTQLNELWAEISRTAAPGAIVIFRTAAEKSILDGRLSPTLLAQWNYRQERSTELGRKDRSAIYGGFHIYEKKEA